MIEYPQHTAKAECRSELLTLAVASLFSRGVNISFSPFNSLEGGDNMFVTLTELLMLITVLIALADYYDRRK